MINFCISLLKNKWGVITFKHGVTTSNPRGFKCPPNSSYVFIDICVSNRVHSACLKKKIPKELEKDLKKAFSVFCVPDSDPESVAYSYCCVPTQGTGWSFVHPDEAVYVKIWTGTKEQWINVYTGAVEIHEA